MKTKQPKRIRQWVNEYSQGSGAPTYCTAFSNKRAAKNNTGVHFVQVAVPLIEIRRGEVVVDVEALVAVYFQPGVWWPPTAKNALRAALKKVGVR